MTSCPVHGQIIHRLSETLVPSAHQQMTWLTNCSSHYNRTLFGHERNSVLVYVTL